MKPKNRIYCRDCGRSKLLFETEKKAFNFIKFNGEEILEESGVAPNRVYYCECCGGYHVTSQEKHYKSYNRTKDVIKRYHKDLEVLKKC